jgi:hypothetical protein
MSPELTTRQAKPTGGFLYILYQVDIKKRPLEQLPCNLRALEVISFQHEGAGKPGGRKS